MSRLPVACDRLYIMIFNDGDMDFPAYATVLFQRHAEYYLDPERLAVTSAVLASKLKAADGNS